MLFSTPAWAETVLYCQDEFAIGIQKRTGEEWKSGNFILKRRTIKLDEKNKTVNPNGYTFKCEFNIGIYRCSFGQETFKLHEKTLRFELKQTMEGWLEYRPNVDIDLTEANIYGTCEKF